MQTRKPDAGRHIMPKQIAAIHFPPFMKSVPVCWKHPAPLKQYQDFTKSLHKIKYMMDLLKTKSKKIWWIKISTP